MKSFSYFYCSPEVDINPMLMKAEEVKTKTQLQPILDLLKESKLPYNDISLKDNLFVAYYNDSGHLVASGGLEFYSGHSLLRSIAIEEKERGKSLGRQVVHDLLNRAKGKSINNVFLLTETAHDFFIKLGFRDINRDQVPPEVLASSEFTSVCPVSAACMVFDFT